MLSSLLLATLFHLAQSEPCFEKLEKLDTKWTILNYQQPYPLHSLLFPGRKYSLTQWTLTLSPQNDPDSDTPGYADIRLCVHEMDLTEDVIRFTLTATRNDMIDRKRRYSTLLCNSTFTLPKSEDDYCFNYRHVHNPDENSRFILSFKDFELQSEILRLRKLPDCLQPEETALQQDFHEASQNPLKTISTQCKMKIGEYHICKLTNSSKKTDDNIEMPQRKMTKRQTSNSDHWEDNDNELQLQPVGPEDKHTGKLSSEQKLGPCQRRVTYRNGKIVPYLSNQPVTNEDEVVIIDHPQCDVIHKQAKFVLKLMKECEKIDPSKGMNVDVQKIYDVFKQQILKAEYVYINITCTAHLENDLLLREGASVLEGYWSCNSELYRQGNRYKRPLK